MTEKLHELLAVVATIDPDAYATGTFTTDWVDMKFVQEVLFVVQVGIITASGTVDFKIEQAKTSTGGTTINLATGTLSITQLDTGDNDSQVLVDVEAEDLTQLYRYVRGSLTILVAGADAAVLAIGGLARFNPASDNDLASVAEITG
ncbi:MAG: hypothetical protein KAJ07_04800 [Planctomycetes bacterium]|nr:hypothetical protein [Planctomycetota bacterium]